MLAGKLRSFYKLPAFIYGFGCWYFNTHMLAMLHSIKCHGCMQTPRSCDIHQVNIITFAHFLPFFLFRGIYIRIMDGTFERFLYRVSFLGSDVTQGFYRNVIYITHTFHRMRASITQANEANAYGLQLWCCKTAHIEPFTIPLAAGN